MKGSNQGINQRIGAGQRGRDAEWAAGCRGFDADPGGPV